jgi:hypothetical protein
MRELDIETKLKLEEKVERLERDMQEIASEVRQLKMLVNQLYALDTSNITPPDIDDDVYIADDFGQAFSDGKPSRIDKDSYRLMQKAREQSKKI